MTQDTFHKYLDDPRCLPEDPPDRELAALMQAVSQLESPEPKPAYWHQFNSRLQTRLNREQFRQRFRWRGWYLGSGLVAATALWLLFTLWPSLTAAPSLENLDTESLAFLSSVYSDYDDSDAVASLPESEAQLLLETYEFENDSYLPSDDEWVPLDEDALDALWKEG